MAHVVILTGPIAAGANTVTEQLAQRLIEDARAVVVADVDDVADMVEQVADAIFPPPSSSRRTCEATLHRWLRPTVARNGHG